MYYRYFPFPKKHTTFSGKARTLLGKRSYAFSQKRKPPYGRGLYRVKSYEKQCFKTYIFLLFFA